LHIACNNYQFNRTETRANSAVNWSASAAVNFNYFEVQQSADGRHWSPVGKVKGQNNTSLEYTYSFTDNAPAMAPIIIV
jgi:hypothetical protein